MRVTDRKIKKIENSLSIKKYFEISVLFFLYNWKTADGMEARFSLQNRPKRAEHTPDKYHAPSYHSFRYIGLQVTSIRPIFKKFFKKFHIL